MNTLVKAFEGHDLRFVEHPEKKYKFGIVADDLATILEHSNSRMMVEFIEPEWLGVSSVYTSAGTRTATVVWEPGIYQLLARSRKPKAKPFQMWLFQDVLPTLFETGSYSAPSASLPEIKQKPMSNVLQVSQEVKEILENTMLLGEPIARAMAFYHIHQTLGQDNLDPLIKFFAKVPPITIDGDLFLD